MLYCHGFSISWKPSFLREGAKKKVPTHLSSFDPRLFPLTPNVIYASGPSSQNSLRGRDIKSKKNGFPIAVFRSRVDKREKTVFGRHSRRCNSPISHRRSVRRAINGPIAPEGPRSGRQSAARSIRSSTITGSFATPWTTIWPREWLRRSRPTDGRPWATPRSCLTSRRRRDAGFVTKLSGERTLPFRVAFDSPLSLSATLPRDDFASRRMKFLQHSQRNFRAATATFLIHVSPKTIFTLTIHVNRPVILGIVFVEYKSAEIHVHTARKLQYKGKRGLDDCTNVHTASEPQFQDEKGLHVQPIFLVRKRQFFLQFFDLFVLVL